MATEPIVTSNSYIATETYTPPVGRLPVLGKVRASIDQMRVAIAATLNEMKNRDAAQALAITKVTAENAALASKTTAEVQLLDQKTATELANVSDTIPAGVGLVAGTITGITGKQKALYTAQTDGFARDAEQKLAKVMADTWGIRRSMDELSLVADNAGLGDDDLKKVFDKARTSIGAA